MPFNLSAGIGALGSLGTGYFQGQDAATERAMRLYQIQRQKDEDAQTDKVRQGMGLGIQALQPPPQPPAPPPMPMPPPPGQSSQPMQQPKPPQGLQLPPQFQVPGMQQPPQQGQMGPNPGLGAPGGQRPPMPPWTAPQAPQAQQQQSMPQGMPQPPQQQGMQPQQAPDLKTVLQKLMSQGMDGETAFRVAQRLEPIMSMEGKMQLQQARLIIQEQQAEAAKLRANTGRMDATRRYDTAAGANAQGAARIFQMTAMGQAALDRAAKYKGGGSGGGIPPAGDVSAMAEAVAAGKVDPNSLSAKGGYRNAVLTKALELNPDYDMKNYGADKAFGTSGMRTAGTASANSAIAATAAQGGADILENAMSKVSRTDFPRINKLLLAAKSEAGIPEVGAAEAALNTFVNEYARSVNPKGTATVYDKLHAREILATADGPEAFKAKMAILRQEMQRAREAPKAVAEDLKKQRKSGASSDKVVDFSTLK